jgi:hypothetical protein
LEDKNLQSGLSKQGESEVIVERNSEKIEVEIREIMRIRPEDLKPFKDSFESWVDSWQ